MNEPVYIVYDNDPCADCDFARAFCGEDFETCQKRGNPFRRRPEALVPQTDSGF